VLWEPAGELGVDQVDEYAHGGGIEQVDARAAFEGRHSSVGEELPAGRRCPPLTALRGGHQRERLFVYNAGTVHARRHHHFRLATGFGQRKPAHAVLGVKTHHTAWLAVEGCVIPDLAAWPEVLIGEVQRQSCFAGGIQRRPNLAPVSFGEVGRFEPSPIHDHGAPHALPDHLADLSPCLRAGDLPVPEPIRAYRVRCGRILKALVKCIQ